jgi:hypothetical protein
MTTTVLLIFLMTALSIALHDRRIGVRSFTWWAVQSIALAMFVIGRQL